MLGQNLAAAIFVITCALSASACAASDAMTMPDKPAGTEETIAVASTGEVGETLNTKVSEYLRDHYDITDATYHIIGADIPWIAVSKNVSNQMAESGRQKTIMEWHRAGMDLIDIYPGEDGAFAVAMASKPLPDGRNLVGYFALAATDN